MWSEFVDKTNIVARLFPFVGAVAERYDRFKFGSF
jgi:hypothetical protein